jgi:hypothetical protein
MLASPTGASPPGKFQERTPKERALLRVKGRSLPTAGPLRGVRRAPKGRAPKGRAPLWVKGLRPLRGVGRSPTWRALLRIKGEPQGRALLWVKGEPQGRAPKGRTRLRVKGHRLPTAGPLRGVRQAPKGRASLWVKGRRLPTAGPLRGVGQSPTGASPTVASPTGVKRAKMVLSVY